MNRRRKLFLESVMLCDWGVGHRVRVSASVDGYAIIVRGEYVIWDMKDYC